MAKLYFLKLTTNDEKVYELQDKRIKLEEIMNEVYNNINDTEVYEKERAYYDKGKEEKVKIVEERYNFSEISKYEDDGRKFVVGKLLRRKPIFTEEYDELTKKANEVVYDKNATSIRFYFDIDRQIIAFSTRAKFGHIQFKEGFEILINKVTNTLFRVGFITNAYSFIDLIKSYEKVNVIEATYIPVNANEEEYKALLDEVDEEMKEINAHQHREYYKSNSGGINLSAKRIKKVMDEKRAVEKLKRGYSEITAEAENRNGDKVLLNSAKDSPFNTEVEGINKMGLEPFIENIKKSMSLVLLMLTNTRK